MQVTDKVSVRSPKPRWVGSIPTACAKNKNAMGKKYKIDLDDLVEYCRKNGTTITIDRNPSPEKITRIREQIKKNKRNVPDGHGGRYVCKIYGVSSILTGNSKTQI